MVAGIAAALGLLAVRAISPDAQPFRRTDPIAAAGDRCVMRVAAGRLRPPVSGGQAIPAASGVYSTSPPVASLVGALRRGAVVVQYQSRLASSQVEVLRRAFATGIVTPDASSMPYLVAGTAWRRLIGCRMLDARVLAALKRFEVRYSGHGPDAGP